MCKTGTATCCSYSPLEIPFCRSQSIALEVSPSQAFSASLQSSIGAPVRSRKIFTSAADTEAMERRKTDRRAGRQTDNIFSSGYAAMPLLHNKYFYLRVGRGQRVMGGRGAEGAGLRGSAH